MMVHIILLYTIFIFYSNCINLYCVGDDIKKLEESYNQVQRQWMDNMINACQVCVELEATLRVLGKFLF